MSEIFGKNKKEQLKELIRQLHKGAKFEEVKEQFSKIIQGVDATEIARIEEELIKEGMPVEEIHKLCDVHIAMFKESLEKEKAIAPVGHPINILMEEHKILLSYAGEIKKTVEDIKNKKSFEDAKQGIEFLNHIAEHFKDSEKHYLREENVLFPYLEKHGITQPPAIMWSEHNVIREQKKRFYEVLEKKGDFSKFVKNIEMIGNEINQMLGSHFYKENNILFPTSMKVITDEEWKEIKREFDDIGYCCFTPGVQESVSTVTSEKRTGVEQGKINLETGSFTVEELEFALNTLPVDITFVDKNDTVAYFSQTKERIFTRTKAVIGRKVQQCHPQKSIHIVNQILEDFKNKKRDSAEFWINLNGRLIYIRYFAVRDKNGDYLGCLEVTQDITEIQKITGEKRLL
jgi:PAS domain S-box-containing protein